MVPKRVIKMINNQARQCAKAVVLDSLSANGDRVPTPAAHTSPFSSIVTGKAISVFNMDNPFGGTAKNEASQSKIPMKTIA